MKLRNILSVLCFLFVAVACSMEDDILNDLDTKATGDSDIYASVNLSLQTSTTGVTTKSNVSGPTGGSSEMTGSEYGVWNCYIAVFEYNEGKVGEFLTSHFYQGYDDITTAEDKDGHVYNLGKHIIFKIPNDESKRKDLKIVAIAQIQADVTYYSELGSVSYEDLTARVLGDQPNTLVKVGEMILLKGDNSDYSNNGISYIHISKNMSDLGNDEKVHSPINIELTQRSAAVMLNSFKILNSNNEPYKDVTITDVQLLNGKMKGRVKGEVKSGQDIQKEQSIRQVSISQYDDNDPYLTLKWENGGQKRFNELLQGTYQKTDKEESYGASKDEYRLYSYENTLSAKTVLKISYTYNGGKETGTCEFSVKSREDSDTPNAYVEQVWANHLYKFDVTIKNAVATATISCSTNDWKEGGVIEVPVQK